MANGIDYRLIQDIGGARQRGGAQAISQMQGITALEDYMAKQGAKAAIGGEGGTQAFYEQEMRRDQYTKDVQSQMPFITKMITVGDREGLEKLNMGLSKTHGDLHATELTNLIPGQYAELKTTKPGSTLVTQFPQFASMVDPNKSYDMLTKIGADGATQVTGLVESTAKAPETMLLEVNEKGEYTPGVEHMWTKDPATGKQKTYIAPRKTVGTGRGDGGAGGGKWEKDAATRLDKLYGRQTEFGIEIFPERMGEYKMANTYLGDYRDRGLTASDAAVLASFKAREIREPDVTDAEGNVVEPGRVIKPQGVDPIEQVIEKYRGAGKTDQEIAKLLKQSKGVIGDPAEGGVKINAINPRTYGLTSGGK